MSELKAIHAFDVYEAYTKTGDDDAAQVYLKSEADNVIAELKNIDSKNRSAYYKDLAMMAKDVEHHKHKRCLAMAEMCEARYDEEDAKVNGMRASWEYISKEMKYWERWRNRWLKIAEKFKTN